MINAFHLSDATPIALFGMFSLWAAASKRHWFVRTAVVGGTILVALLIPAYEVVILLGVQCLLVVAGLAIWRRRRRTTAGASAASPPFRLRLSLQTLMLAVVLVAVATVVASRTPRITLQDWYELSVDGFIAGAACLACVWIVCGRAAWWMRLILSPLILILFGAGKHVLHWTGHVARYWYYQGSIAEYLPIAFRDLSGLQYTTIGTSLGMAILCAWLFVMRRAGWFDPFGELSAAPPGTAAAKRQTIVARVAALVLFGLVSLFPIALFYRLMTPTPIPDVKLPDPNGYDDLIAAGKMIGPVASGKLTRWDQLSNGQLRAELAQHTAAFDRMHAGLRKASWNPYVFKLGPQEDAHTIYYLLTAMQAQSTFARRTGNLHAELATYIDMLRVGQAQSQGSAAEDYPDIAGQSEKTVQDAIWGLRKQLTAPECIELAAVLSEIDRRREPWETRAERRRIIEGQAGWKRRAHVILDEWSGKGIEAWRRDNYLKRVAELRILIVELGIRAFQLENQRLPENLSELVPKYLPAVPDDPFGTGPIKFRLVAELYKLYSIGPDRIDDRGQQITFEGGGERGDLIDSVLFPQPLMVPSTNVQSSPGQAAPDD